MLLRISHRSPCRIQLTHKFALRQAGAFSNSLEVGGGLPFANHSIVAHHSTEHRRMTIAQSSFPSQRINSLSLSALFYISIRFRSLFYISWIINAHIFFWTRATHDTLSLSPHSAWHELHKRRASWERAHDFPILFSFRIRLVHTTHSRIHIHLDLFFGLFPYVCKSDGYICGAEWAHWAQARSDQHRVTNTRTQQQQQLHTIFELSRDNNCASGEKMPLVHSEHSRIIVRYSGFIATHLAPLKIQQQIIERKIFYF